MLSETASPDNSGKSRLAGKKIIIYLTIFSMLNLVGCYYQQQVTLEEFDFECGEDIRTTTKDATYSLGADDYYFNNDTLIANLPQVKYSNYEWVRYKTATKIPAKEIEKFEIEKIDEAATTWLVVGVVVIAAAVIVNFAMGDYGIDF